MKYLTINFRVFVFIIISVMHSGFAFADLMPADRDFNFSTTVEMNSLPSNITMWTNESGGYSTTNANLYGRNTLLCTSNSTAQYGRCPVTPSWGYTHTEPNVPITLTEKRTRAQVTISLIIRKNRWGTNDNCSNQSGGSLSPFNAVPIQTSCGFNNNETRFSAYIAQGELQKIPFPGIWETELRMNLMQWSPQIILARWNTNIMLNVKNTSSQQIYVPQFPTASPIIDLNLRPLPGSTLNRTTMEGSNSIDICLYDGFGSNSSRIKMLLRDEGKNSINRVPGMFSIYHEDGTVGINNRLDYNVTMVDLSGSGRRTVNNNEEMVWINPGLTARSVILPGMLHPVLCHPSNLHLITPPFSIADKKAGRYKGKLTIIFTPET